MTLSPLGRVKTGSRLWPEAATPFTVQSILPDADGPIIPPPNTTSWRVDVSACGSGMGLGGNAIGVVNGSARSGASE